FVLVPVVAVAWADGSVDERERAAILEAAERNGVAPGGPGHALLESWLATQPPPELLETWSHYTRAICAGLSAADRQWLASFVLQRVRAVARTSGGLLGLLSVSRSEQELIDHIEKQFAA